MGIAAATSATGGAVPLSESWGGTDREKSDNDSIDGGGSAAGTRPPLASTGGAVQ